MSVSVTVAGTSYTIPSVGDVSWGPQVTSWIQAISAVTLQTTGGSFVLTGDLNFGGSFGLVSLYYKSFSSNIAGSGVIRLANGDAIGWRNIGNSADLLLKPDADGILQYNSIDLVNLSATQSLTNKTFDSTSTMTGVKIASFTPDGTHTLTAPAATDTLAAIAAAQTLTNKTMSGSSNTFSNIGYASLNLSNSIVNSDINASAAIAYSKLNLSGSVVNADINSAAAIAYSKLNLSGSVVNADISNSAAIAYSKLNLTGNVVNADISASAAIAYSKLNLSASIQNSDLAGAVSIAKGGTGQTSASAGFNALAPATAKGGLIAGTGSNTYGNLAVGTDGQVLQADSTQTDGFKWTTLNQGAKNYVTYNNFENNATTGWSLGNVSALTNGFPSNTSPTFGSGSSGNLSITTVSSGQLAGTYSLSYVSSAATTAGDFLASQAYTIDAEDQAKVLTFKFYYKTNSGASNNNYSGTSSNSFGVAIWDTANSAWIQPSSCFGMVQGTGIGYVTGTFQTPSNMSSFRLVVYNANATSGATTLYFDDFYVGPQTAPFGPAVTDWQSYTPAFVGYGTATSINCQWRRVGDSVQIRGAFTTGTTTGVTGQIGLPSGLTSSSSIPASNIVCGSAAWGANTAGGLVTLCSPSVTYVNIGVQTAATNGNTPVLGSACGNGVVNTFDAVVPVQGWSSNSAMSADTDTRVVACKAYLSTNFTGSGTIGFNLVAFDTHAAFNTSTHGYVVPVSGYYLLSCDMSPTGSSAVQVQKNGSAIADGPSSSYITYCLNGQQNSGARVFKFNAGDSVTLSLDSSITVQASQTTFEITRISGPAVVSATESVNCNYSDASGASIGTSLGVFKFQTKTFDTHNAYSTSTGLYTAPVSGKYRVSFNIYSSGVSLSTSQFMQSAVYKNGSLYQYLNQMFGNGTSESYNTNGSLTVALNAGDTVGVYVSSGVSTTGNVTAGANNISIERIGN